MTNSELNKQGKTDYNFVADGMYEMSDWSNRNPGQPFFAQLRLRDGKVRDMNVDEPVDSSKVTLPPYYPDHPVLRRDWATYLKSWIKTDRQIGQILQRLRQQEILDQTIIFSGPITASAICAASSSFMRRESVCR